jgi:hypothetical protein
LSTYRTCRRDRRREEDSGEGLGSKVVVYRKWLWKWKMERSEERVRGVEISGNCGWFALVNIYDEFRKFESQRDSESDGLFEFSSLNLVLRIVIKGCS